jgi:hypothetical protein
VTKSKIFAQRQLDFIAKTVLVNAKMDTNGQEQLSNV